MFNPMAYMTPQQLQQVEQVRAVGKRVKARIDRYPARVEVCLTAEDGDEEAEQYLPTFSQAACQTVGNTLHFFGVTGEIVDHS